MTLILKVLTILLLFNFFQSIIIQPKGPTFRKYAAQCIKTISDDAHEYISHKLRNFSKILVTFLVNNSAATPTYEIQNMVLKQLSADRKWTIETLQATKSSVSVYTNFESYTDGCTESENETTTDSNNFCRRKFVEKLKTHFYVIIVNGHKDFIENYVPPLTLSPSFDSHATAMVFVTKVPSNHNTTVKKIINRLNKAVVLIPKNLTNFGLYKMNLDHRNGVPCYSQIFKILTWNTECVKGSFGKRIGNVFQEAAKEDFKNCTLIVKARKYPPYVIDKENGVEIDIIKVAGKALNISFLIDFDPRVRDDLGQPIMNAYTNFLSQVFSKSALAIGNLYPNLGYTKDFTYSVTYHSERLSWVIPRANLIPTWRVLTVIFDLHMWAVCLGVIFGFGILFYLATFLNKEVVSFRTFEKCLTASYEIILAAPVPFQPWSDCTRILFISAAFLAIIINLVYTSSLIQYLTTPVREHQIRETREWLNADPNHLLGGPKPFKTLPKKGSDLREQFERRYITINDTQNDWYTYWLYQVTSKKNIGTLIGRLPVKYLEAINDPLVTYQDGESKIFMFHKVMLIRSVSIMMRKGHPLKGALNNVLQKQVIEGGLVRGFIDKYMRRAISTREKESSSQEKNGTEDEFEDDDDDDDEEEHSHNRPLSTHHLEGAFSILILGQLSGFIVFIFEIIYFQIKIRYIRYKLRTEKLFEFTN